MNQDLKNTLFVLTDDSIILFLRCKLESTCSYISSDTCFFSFKSYKKNVLQISKWPKLRSLLLPPFNILFIVNINAMSLFVHK